MVKKLARKGEEQKEEKMRGQTTRGENVQKGGSASQGRDPERSAEEEMEETKENVYGDNNSNRSTTAAWLNGDSLQCNNIAKYFSVLAKRVNDNVSPVTV